MTIKWGEISESNPAFEPENRKLSVQDEDKIVFNNKLLLIIIVTVYWFTNSSMHCSDSAHFCDLSLKFIVFSSSEAQT